MRSQTGVFRRGVLVALVATVLAGAFFYLRGSALMRTRPPSEDRDIPAVYLFKNADTDEILGRIGWAVSGEYAAFVSEQPLEFVDGIRIVGAAYNDASESHSISGGHITLPIPPDRYGVIIRAPAEASALRLRIPQPPAVPQVPIEALVFVDSLDDIPGRSSYVVSGEFVGVTADSPLRFSPRFQVMASGRSDENVTTIFAEALNLKIPPGEFGYIVRHPAGE